MRRTEEEAAQTRQALLDAALQEFGEKGYQAARLQDVAQRAGTTRGAIYHHFDNKAGLYEALIKEAADQAGQAVAAAIEAGGTFEDVFRRIFVLTMQMLVEDVRFRRIMALSLFRTGVSPELTVIDEQRIADAEAQVENVAGFMRMGMEQGHLRTDIAPETAARAYLAMQNGIALLWLRNGEYFDISAESAPLASVLWRGLASV